MPQQAREGTRLVLLAGATVGEQEKPTLEHIHPHICIHDVVCTLGNKWTTHSTILSVFITTCTSA